MDQRRLILVPLDGSPASRTALPAARRVAEIVDGEICILHVREQPSGPALGAPIPSLPSPPTPLPVGQDQERRRGVRVAHAASAATLTSQLGLTAAETASATLVEAVGAPATAIVRTAQERHAWLIVMSTQGERAWRARQLGSTTAAVIQQAECGVLAIRPDMPESRRSLASLARVLVPLDGSPGAAAAVALAADLVKRTGARLDLLHVATLHKPPPAERGTMVGPRYLDQPGHEWSAWAQEFLRRFEPLPQGWCALPVELHTAHGDPSEEILRFAREQGSDLIATAWRQTLALGRAEVVKRLLAEAPCPILFVQAAHP
ncbi:MAG: universal stress protein [Chloroflexi bacterium]|nr:universal stress protein [Chloroflexota bacterium]